MKRFCARVGVGVGMAFLAVPGACMYFSVSSLMVLAIYLGMAGGVSRLFPTLPWPVSLIIAVAFVGFVGGLWHAIHEAYEDRLMRRLAA